MDNTQPHGLAQGSDIEAKANLAEYLEANRVKVREPSRLTFGHLELSPESAAAAADREARDQQRMADRQRAELIERARGLVAAAGERYRNCLLDNFECVHPQQGKVVSTLREYADRDVQENVILYGPVGTGKDHLAFAVCRAAIKAGRTVWWINGQTWFGIVRDAMDTDKSEASLIAELVRPDLLCLSDPLPPVGPLTPFQTTMLYRLVDARYSRIRPTICTINVANDAEADERLGAATWDRLTHGAWKLHCAWPTHRNPAREV